MKKKETQLGKKREWEKLKEQKSISWLNGYEELYWRKWGVEVIMYMEIRDDSIHTTSVRIETEWASERERTQRRVNEIPDYDLSVTHKQSWFN